MQIKSIRRYIAATILGAAALAAAHCAGERAFRQGATDETTEKWDQAMENYAKAHEQAPTNIRYKMAFDRAKRKASQVHFTKGKMYLDSGRPDLAIVELEQTTLLDPENDYAALELSRAKEQQAKIEAEKRSPTKMEKLEEETKNARAIGPILQPTSKKPISLNFPQQRPIKQIYQALAQAAGINVIFDPALKDDPVTIVLSNVDFKNALETLIRQEGHFYKIVDTHTILIAADTAANRKNYEDLVIKTFYLSNGDVTEVANAIRALLGTVHVSINKAENAITIRDTADKVSIAQRIIDQNDKEKAEVVVDVELLQVNTTKLLNLGLELPTSISANFLAPVQAPTGSTGVSGASGTSGTQGTPTTVNSVTLEQLKHLSLSQYGFTVPNFTVNFMKNNSDAQILAKPQLRISEGEKAQLLIGDKVPIPVTTFSSTFAGTTGGVSATPVTSFQYQDVGIKIEMEPRVHHNKEITLKLTVEVSNLDGNVQGQPQIGTRTITSTIRLKDGETNFLAGLIRRDKQNSADEVPFLADIPIIGRFFSNHNDQAQNTDLVMTITPHIIRLPDINEEDLLPVYVGTENNISFQGSPRVESVNDARGPFEAERPSRATQQPNDRQIPPANPGFTVPGGSTPSNPFAPPKATAIPTPDSGTKSPRTGLNPQALVAEPEPSASPSAQLGLEPPIAVLPAGEERTLQVTASTLDGQSPATFSLTFDPSVVAVEHVTMLESGNFAMPESGRLRFLFSDLRLEGAPRAVAEVTIRGLSTGVCDLKMDSADVFDATGKPLAINAHEALVQVP